MFVLFNYYTTMEKLLNMLNEYESESWIIKDENIVKIGCDDYWLPCTNSYKLCIISKSYWFIDWLVKNDKIKDNGIKQRTDLVKEIQIVDYETGKSLWWKNQYSETEQLIMYLSIQDNPLEYLCSILK